MPRPLRPQRPPGPSMGPRAMGLRGPRGPPPMHPLGPPPGLHPGMRPPVAGGHVSSCTNSTDPASMDSRLFVGNLNTLALGKEDVESIFSQYGLILGISMHKGYCFVQFSHPKEARLAGASEDGNMYAGQAVDINVVSQPKKRNALKRSSGGRAVNDEPTKKVRSENAGTNQSLQRTLVTLSESGEPNRSNKKTATNNSPRVLVTASKRSAASAKSSVRPESAPPVATVNTQNSDILICGSCKLQFTSLNSLTVHKKIPCQLRVSMQAKGDAFPGPELGEPSLLECVICDAEFSSAWALCLHCSEEHEMSIYKTKSSSETLGLTDNGDHS